MLSGCGSLVVHGTEGLLGSFTQLVVDLLHQGYNRQFRCTMLHLIAVWVGQATLKYASCNTLVSGRAMAPRLAATVQNPFCRKVQEKGACFARLTWRFP